MARYGVRRDTTVFLVTHSVDHRVRCQFFDDWQVFRMNEQVKCNEFELNEIRLSSEEDFQPSRSGHERDCET